MIYLVHIHPTHYVTEYTVTVCFYTTCYLLPSISTSPYPYPAVSTPVYILCMSLFWPRRISFLRAYSQKGNFLLFPESPIHCVIDAPCLVTVFMHVNYDVTVPRIKSRPPPYISSPHLQSSLLQSALQSTIHRSLQKNKHHVRQQPEPIHCPVLRGLCHRHGPACRQHRHGLQQQRGTFQTRPDTETHAEADTNKTSKPPPRPEVKQEVKQGVLQEVQQREQTPAHGTKPSARPRKPSAT